LHAAVVPAVEIAVWALRLGEVLDDRVDLAFDRLVAPVGERVTRRLDPLADVGVPEHLHGEAVVIERDRKRRRRLWQF